MGRGKARLSVDDGAHLVKIHLATEAGSGKRSLRAGEAAADDTNQLLWSSRLRLRERGVLRALE